MKLLAMTGLVATALAAADPQITPAPALELRQNSDPALLGWVSSGSAFSDQRSCDFPATLSSSGSLAQCCSGNNCIFWSSCSAGTLFASQTSLFCDQGYCNTAVLVPTVGASNGQNYLGCWATSLGQSPFTIVRDIGSAPIASKTGSVSGSPAASSARSAASRVSSAASAASSAAGGASSSAPPAQSSGAAAVTNIQPWTGVAGLIAMFFGMI